jgi:hypothetical protein
MRRYRRLGLFESPGPFPLKGQRSDTVVKQIAGAGALETGFAQICCKDATLSLMKDFTTAIFGPISDEWAKVQEIELPRVIDRFMNFRIVQKCV